MVTLPGRGQPGSGARLQATGFREYNALLELSPETCSLRPKT